MIKIEIVVVILHAYSRNVQTINESFLSMDCFTLYCESKQVAWTKSTVRLSTF